MLLQFIISNILVPYFITGVIVAVLLDVLIRFQQTGKPFTFGDIWASILFWPIMVSGFIKGCLNQ